MPHFGQAWCGSLRSWQLGHSESDRVVSPSCERRFAVRCLEWRRFGFGIEISLSPTGTLDRIHATNMAEHSERAVILRVKTIYMNE